MARLRGANLMVLALAALGSQCFAGIATTQTQADYLRGIFSTPSTYDPSPVRLQIGDDDYDIPKNALFAFPSNEQRQRDVLLQLLYPEMEGLTLANNAEMLGVGQDSRRIQILISDHSTNPHPQSGSQGVNAAYSARVTFWVQYGGTVATVDDAQLGLRRLTVSNRRSYDVFVDSVEQEGARSFVIECSRFDKVPNPNCSLFFAYRNLIVKTSFVRSRLPEWRPIRAAVSRWMDERRVQGKVRQDTRK